MAIHKSVKGMSVVARQDIAQGQFVAQYAGEMLTNLKADERLADYDNKTGVGHALLVVREMLPSGKACLRFNIDATRIGNIARFFNHSCDGGNLELEVVRSRGSQLPHVAMFASKDIQAGQEITFSYGQPATGSETVLPLPTTGQDSCSMQHVAEAAVVFKSHHRRRCFCGSKSCHEYLPGN